MIRPPDAWASPPQALLKWPGSKSHFAHEIVPLLMEVEPDRVLDPFCGSCAILGATKANYPGQRVFVSDINQRLMNVLWWVEREPEMVWNELQALGTDPAVYNEVREAFNHSQRAASVTQAARMLWLNRACFNGLFRENRKGDFNVPRGACKVVPLVPLDTLLWWSNALTYSVAHGRDVQALATAADAVYCDPPYLPAPGSGAFTSYSSGPFGLAEHRVLMLRIEASVAKRTVVSNALHDGTRALYDRPGWRLEKQLTVRRAIGGKGARREPAPEGVWVFER